MIHSLFELGIVLQFKIFHLSCFGWFKMQNISRKNIIFIQKEDSDKIFYNKSFLSLLLMTEKCAGLDFPWLLNVTNLFLPVYLISFWEIFELIFTVNSKISHEKRLNYKYFSELTYFFLPKIHGSRISTSLRQNVLSQNPSKYFY